MDIKAALADIDDVLKSPAPLSDGYAQAAACVARFEACIHRIAPPGSRYREQAARLAEKDLQTSGPQLAEFMRGVLQSLREDVARDRIGDFESIVRANVYADLLSQAEGLTRDGYHRAATVVSGAALEEHIKKLAAKHNVALVDSKGHPQKASVLNSELRKAHVYSEAQRAIVEGWQKLRNEAAHGSPGFEATNTQYVASVGPMITGVRGFVAQHPA